MAARLLKLGEGETFSLAIQMLPYLLNKDDRTWLTQAIDDTASDDSRFARLMVDGGGDSAQAERLALAIQQEYRQGRDMPTSWIGRAFNAATDQVPKVAAVTGSSLLASPGVNTFSLSLWIRLLSASFLFGGHNYISLKKYQIPEVSFFLILQYIGVH